LHHNSFLNTCGNIGSGVFGDESYFRKLDEIKKISRFILVTINRNC
jgi:hypothetical protein